MPESEWSTVFPLANSIYSYEGFLKSVGKFPYFCDDVDADSGMDLETACKKELATLFAHWTQETGLHDDTGANGEEWTQALYHVEEINRGDYKSTNWSADAWPPS